MEQAVFELIDRHQSFEALLKEASDEVDCAETNIQASQEMPSLAKATASCQKSLNLSIDACLSCIRVKSHISGTPITTVAALECAKQLCHLLQEVPHTKSDEKKRNTQCLIEVLRSLASQQLLNRTLFIQQLSSKVEALPLELLWQLHSCSAVSLDSYLECSLARPAVLQNFGENLSAFCLRADGSDEESVKIKRGVLEVLLRCGYSKSEEGYDIDQRLATACQDILDRIVLDLLKVQNQTSDSAPSDHVAKLFEMIRCNPSIDKDAISRFSKRQLQSLLSGCSNCEVTTAITKQHDHWTYTKAPSSHTKMFIQLLLTVHEKQICSVLQEVLESKKINWQLTLILVSVFCVCFRQGAALIKGLVANLLRESLESFRPLLLHAAFLLARQAAAEGSCDFPSYTQWFKDQFGTASGPHLTSSKAFTFFMEFLNSLVPHEPVHCLKAHVQHPPYTTSKSRDVLLDYVALAKTRLADFKESWQTSDIAGASTSGKAQTGNQSAMEAVEIAVTHYEKTGRIQDRVLQASIFRRPYYIGQFLPALLTPRMLPDIPDSKMKFIEALKRDEKVPLPMYNKYTEACATELAAILEGVSSEDMNEMVTAPIDRLQDCLDSLPQNVIKESTQASHYADVSGYISLISRRVSAVLEDLNILPADMHSTEGASTILLDIGSGSSIEPTIMQVTDMLLGCFCKTHMVTAKDGLSCAALVECFTSMLATQGALHLPLYHRLFTLICHQGKTLAEDHIKSLASLLLHMNALGERLPPVKLQTHSTHGQKQQQDGEPDQMSLLNLVSKNLQLHTGDAMKLTLKFCDAVFTYASDLPESRQSQVIPQVLKQKCSYLRPRLDPAYRPEFALASRQSTCFSPSSSQTTVSVDRSTEGATKLLSSQDQMTFKEWLRQELRVHLCQDCLNQTQRKKYHHWALYSLYLPQHRQPSSPENTRTAYKRVSTDILHALLDRYAEPAVTTSECCPHEAKPCQSCGCSSSCQEILQLLQELLSVWSPAMPHSTPPIASDCPWLLAEFGARLEKLSKAGTGSEVDQKLELAVGLEVSNQIMLSHSLPPYLLLTDNLHNPPKPPGLNPLIDYVNVQLREHAQEEFGILSYEIVAVILQGVLQLFTHTVQTEPTRLNNVAAIVDRLLQECPIFTLSVLSHWEMLNPVIGQLNATSSNQPRLLASLNQLHKLVHSICRTDSQTCYMSPDRIQANTCIIVVVSSMLQLVQRTDSFEDLANFEVKLYQKLGETFKKDDIRRSLFEYHVAQSAWLMITCPTHTSRIEAHCQAAGLVLKEQPHCLMDCTGLTMLRRDVLQKSVTSLYSVVCFRILDSYFCLGVQQQATNDHQLFATIVQLYTSLVHLHCQANQPITALPGQETTGGHQLLDLKFIHSSLSMVQKIIVRSSRQTLASVNATISAGTDPELRNMITQKLKNG
ncbi:Fanconi anemia group A protein homolog [Patiria miniata]|uniref:Fanconi anemia group A protein n=1 Tax=Patiria miniata TaxID=46514 RepID=A0A914A7N8_PATMI|nr:Fanconi anemia group A protein homolog [Patiria miniata]